MLLWPHRPVPRAAPSRATSPASPHRPTPRLGTGGSDAPAPGATVRRDAGLYGYERALRRAGIELVAGVDEAGRGACAGPLVAGAAILRPGKAGEIPGLADSKLLTEKARERVLRPGRQAGASPGRWWSSSPTSATGSACTWPTSRRSAARSPCSTCAPAYVLTDGFPVDGLGVPGLAVWKGDRVAACISAASVLAKVTRDRIMVALDRDHPAYDFKTHKGYSPTCTTPPCSSTARAPSTGCGS